MISRTFILFTILFLSITLIFAQEVNLFPQEITRIQGILQESSKHTGANYSLSLTLENGKPYLKISRSFQLAPGKINRSIQEVYLQHLDASRIEAMTSGLDVPGLKLRTKNNSPKVRMITIIDVDQAESEEKRNEDKTFLSIVCDKKSINELQKAFEDLLAKNR